MANISNFISSPTPGGGGGGRVTVNGTTVNAPYASLDQVAISNFVASGAATAGNITNIVGVNRHSTAGNIAVTSDSTTREAVNITGAGALQYIYLHRSSLQFGNSVSIGNATITITIDGGTPFVIQSDGITSPFSTSNATVSSNLIIGGMPLTTSAGPVTSPFASTLINATPHYGATFSNNVAEYTLVTGATNTDRPSLRGFAPAPLQWFGHGLPWIRFDQSLLVQYNIGNANRGSNVRQLTVQTHTF